MMTILFAFLLGLFCFLMPNSIQSEEIELPLPEAQDIEFAEERELSSGIEPSRIMTQQQIDELLGPDPYLGPTSWLDGKKKQ